MERTHFVWPFDLQYVLNSEFKAHFSPSRLTAILSLLFSPFLCCSSSVGLWSTGRLKSPVGLILSNLVPHRSLEIKPSFCSRFPEAIAQRTESIEVSRFALIIVCLSPNSSLAMDYIS